jgi:hypothetical protein
LQRLVNSCGRTIDAINALKARSRGEERPGAALGAHLAMVAARRRAVEAEALASEAPLD